MLIEDGYVALYSILGKIYFVFNDEHFEVKDMSVVIEITQDLQGYKHLLVEQDSKIYVFKYVIREKADYNNLTFYPEQEDYDFGLWLKNLLESEARREAFISGNRKI